MRRAAALKIQQACPGNADIDEARGHCHTCDKAVHDLTGMSWVQAEAFLRQREGEEFCASYRVDPQRRPQFRGETRSPVRVAMIAGAIATLAACTPWGMDTPGLSAMPDEAAACAMAEPGSLECVGSFAQEPAQLPVLEDAEETIEGCSAPVYQSYGDPLTSSTSRGSVVNVELSPQLDPQATGAIPLRGEVAMGMLEAHHPRRFETPTTLEVIAYFRERRAERKRRRAGRK